MWKVSKLFKFACAHKLDLDYDSPCKSIHGHEYYVRVIINANKLNNDGMVIDFYHLKKFEKYLNDNYDHSTLVKSDDIELIHYLNMNKQKYVSFDTNTTAEAIAERLCENFVNMFYQEGWTEVEMQVWETLNNYASYIKKL